MIFKTIIINNFKSKNLFLNDYYLNFTGILGIHFKHTEKTKIISF